MYLDALGAKRIPDPTTAGDFCRRFTEPDVITLMDIFNRVRLRVWRQQPSEFFDEAIVDAAGTIVPSDAECKQGMEFATYCAAFIRMPCQSRGRRKGRFR